MFGFWILLLAISLGLRPWYTKSGSKPCLREAGHERNSIHRLQRHSLCLPGWLLYDSTIHEWDPWFAFVVGFVLVIAIVTSMIPSLHAKGVSPGHYPEDE